ncbi:MAG: carboxypeptidase-like regulatory domain-containing protein [Saprospiraceae bacterium]|nr:carboxypeptidase-like regulatory domain-containing protein [Saprospiraceae bacterium]
MRFLPIIITLVFLTNISFIGAQKTATIRGAITEMGNGNPLIGATIYIVELQKGEVTDFNGDYTLNQIKSGTYTLITSYIGYNTDTSTLVINNNLEVIHNVNLTVEGLTLETVTVTAQAEGQMAAINRQISNDNIVNVVSAKRIQEVPDANAAETLGRLSGVSLVRSGGEGSKVSIRGMAPSFNKVQVEGMRMASTGEGDRSTDLSMISPYMLEGIELTKAAMAENEADAIGGSVNFILREAPEKPTFDLLMQSGYASYKQRFNNQKVVLGGSKRLFSNKLGIFAQVDLDQRDRSANEINVNYINRTNLLDNFPISTGSMSLRDIDRTVKKGGATIVLDYKLKGGSIKFSNFGSIIKKKENIQYELFNPFFNTHSYGYNQRNPNLNIYNSALKMDKKLEYCC